MKKEIPEKFIKLFLSRWGRRCLSISVIISLFIMLLSTLPLWIFVSFGIDAIRRNRWAVTRSSLFFIVYLVCEIIGIIAGFFIWLVGGTWIGVGQLRFLELNYRLQRWWARVLFTVAVRLFNITLQVEGTEEIESPFILFVRHASLPDVILPSALFLIPRGIHIRHVMKQELLWDPCLDIVGNRVPNVFLDRSSPDNIFELAKLRALVKGLNDVESVMIYPEGTRFTKIKRHRIIKKLEEKGDAWDLEYAKSLNHLLPPRLGGSLALLESNENASAVFCAHVGFEAVGRAVDFVNGSLIDAVIRVKLWQIPYEKIPLTRDRRIAWLWESWRRMDEWINTQSSQEKKS